MSVGEWIGVATGILALLTTCYFSARALLATTRADEQRASDSQRLLVAAARAEEQALCKQRVDDLLRDRDDLARERDERARERDAERARADGLQNLINQWRIQGGR